MEARTMCRYWMVTLRPSIQAGREFLLATSFPLSIYSQPYPTPVLDQCLEFQCRWLWVSPNVCSPPYLIPA